MALFFLVPPLSPLRFCWVCMWVMLPFGLEHSVNQSKTRQNCCLGLNCGVVSLEPAVFFSLCVPPCCSRLLFEAIIVVSHRRAWSAGTSATCPNTQQACVLLHLSAAWSVFTGMRVCVRLLMCVSNVSAMVGACRESFHQPKQKNHKAAIPQAAAVLQALGCPLSQSKQVLLHSLYISTSYAVSGRCG